MQERICPACGLPCYSAAAERAWRCPRCGAVIPVRKTTILESTGGESMPGTYFHRASAFETRRTLCDSCANATPLRCEFMAAPLIRELPCILDDMGADYIWTYGSRCNAETGPVVLFKVVGCPHYTEGPLEPARWPEADASAKAALAGRFRRGGLRQVNIISGGLY